MTHKESHEALASDERLSRLCDWLSKHLETPLQRLMPLTNDASFRRYFRVHCGNAHYVAMDAPPHKESCTAFVAIAKTFLALGIQVPVIYAQDLAQGFLLMTDFGDRWYVDALTPQTCDTLYQRAFDALLLIQSCTGIEGYVLPQFDAALYFKEMNLFHEWYLSQYLGRTVSTADLATLKSIYTLLAEDALSQPQVCVHRDYHSRNLMVVDHSSQPGILDFQDAVWGPITYDILSLLRDCYIEWPPQQVEALALKFQKQMLRLGLLRVEDPQPFLRWMDWIGLQRHLKCIGIFARLKVRDNKSTYLQYIPRVIRYAQRVCERYPELELLKPFLNRSA